MYEAVASIYITYIKHGNKDFVQELTSKLFFLIQQEFHKVQFHVKVRNKIFNNSLSNYLIFTNIYDYVWSGVDFWLNLGWAQIREF